MQKQSLLKTTLIYLASLGIVCAWTFFVKFFFPKIELVNLVMTYLLVNVLIAILQGQGPALVATVASITLFDFFFVPPYGTLAVTEAKYWITFSIMLLVTVLTGRLIVRLDYRAKALRKAEQETERERLVSSLLSSISHDLKTPLTSISGTVDTLLSTTDLGLEKQSLFLQTIKQESLRLGRLIENALQAAKLEASASPLKKENNSLEEVIGNALNRLDPFLKDRPVLTSIPVGMPLTPMDAILMEQVFVNLIENAIHHAPTSPIEIEVSWDSHQVSVEILDRGPGIPLEECQRIFEKFYRSGKQNSWGSGLGLAICDSIIKVHQGQLGVKERVGGGSIFYFSIPL